MRIVSALLALWIATFVAPANAERGGYGTQWAASCPPGTVITPSGRACMRIGWNECANRPGHSCPSGETCHPTHQSCIPLGSVACRGGGYCPRGYVCQESRGACEPAGQPPAPPPRPPGRDAVTVPTDLAACIGVPGRKAGNWWHYSIKNSCAIAVTFEIDDCDHGSAGKSCRVRTVTAGPRSTSLRQQNYIDHPNPRNHRR